MRITRYLGLGAVFVSLTVPGYAFAQVILNAPGFTSRPPPPRPPDVRSAPLAWPRLDPGAPLCRSEADLQRLAARRQGEPVDGPTDCRIITTPTAVTIIERRGPGSTHVRLTDAQTITGWTNVWLPDKAPATAGR